MSYKSRGNFNINKCLKKDCININIKCNICIKFSEYLVKCACENARICLGMSLTERLVYDKCFNCKGAGKIKGIR